MRAVIAARFPAYTFEMLDRLLLDDLVEMYASALWLAEEEGKAANKGKRKRK